MARFSRLYHLFYLVWIHRNPFFLCLMAMPVPGVVSVGPAWRLFFYNIQGGDYV
jgi:hypothetical protein